MGHVELTQVLVKFLAAKGLEQICMFHMDVAKKCSKSSPPKLAFAQPCSFHSLLALAVPVSGNAKDQATKMRFIVITSNAKVQACYASQESQEVPLEQKRFELELGLQSLTQPSIETLGIDNVSGVSHI